MMIDVENCRMVKMSESNRYIVRELLEKYRNEATMQMFDNTSEYNQEYWDIMVLEIDEILESIGEE
jgi:hypothetical protein